MKKIVFSAILFFALLSIYMLAVVTFIDFSKLYSQLASTSKISTQNLDNLEYTIDYFPTPTLMIRSIVDNKKIELENIEIKFSPMSVLLFSPKVKALQIGEAKIHIRHDDVRLLSHDEFISELINRNALDVVAKVKRIEFVESDLDIPLVIEDFHFDGVTPNTKFTGQIKNLGSIAGSFLYTGNDQVDFDLKIDSKELHAKINESYKNSLLETGRVEIKAKNIGNKLGRLVPDFSQFSSSINSDEEINISFDINAIDKWMKFNNIKIDSNSILGEGNIELSKSVSDIDQINLKFSKIDLHSLKKASNQDLEGYGGATGSNFDFSKNKMNVNVAIDKMQLTEKNTLTNVVLQSDIDSNKFIIKRFTGNIDENGKFVVAGEASQNNFRSLFIGEVAISHSDLNDLAEYIGGKEVRASKPIPYTFTSKVKLSIVDVSLQNIVVNTGNNELNGNMSIKFIGNFPRISATLALDNLNMNENDFPVVQQVYEYAKNLTQGTKDESYQAKLTPLRQLNSMNNINFSINKLLLGDTKYENFNFNLLLSPGRVKFSNLTIKDRNDFVDMNIDLQAQGIKPLIIVKVNDGSVGVNFLSPSAMLQLKDKILNEFAIDKFDLLLDVYLSKMYQDTFELGRVVFLAKTEGKLITVQNFDTDLFKGRLRSSGSILLAPYTLNFVYALNSAHIKDIIDLLPPGYFYTGGVISASGMWTSTGDSTRELLYNLYTRSTILTKDITINNFSYDNLVERANSQGYTLRDLKTDLKSSLLTGVTVIDELQTDVELSRGILQLPTVKFKTKYTSGAANVAISIYDFTINLDSVFSFRVATDPVIGRSYIDYTSSSIKLKATGSLFSPRKEGDVSELENIIRRRKN